MKKIITRLIFIIILIIILLATYLSTFGIETTKLNNQISSQIKDINKNLDIELKKIRIVLNLIELKINLKTTGAKLKNKEKIIELENIKTQISINSIINNQFSLRELKISTKTIEMKKLISFARSFKNTPELYLLEKIIKKGYLIADLNLEFDSEGKIKSNYSIKGIVRDTKLSFFKKYNLDKLNLIFNLNNKNLKIQDMELLINNVAFSSPQIEIQNVKNKFFVKGQLNNKNIELNKSEIELLLEPYFPKLEIKNISFQSTNNISVKIDKKLNIDELKISSEIQINDMSILNRIKLQNIFPKLKDEIALSNQKIKIDYNDKKISIKGNGKILLQDNFDEISYSVEKENEKYKFSSIINIDKNPFNIDFLSYEKKESSKIDD